MNKKRQIQFAQRCSVLMESGISLSESLSIIIRMENSKKQKMEYENIKKSIDKGISLTRSVSILKISFDPILISMITYGESSGILALSLHQAGEMMGKGGEIKKKIVGAMIYPMFIALATIAMTLFLVMYIFPKIIPLFSTMNIDLPLLTRIVKKIYELLVQYGLWGLISFFIITTILYFIYKRKKRLRMIAQSIILRIPLIGSIIQRYIICNQCRTIETLLDCGQTLPPIILRLAPSSPMDIYRSSWSISHTDILRGIALSDSLRSFKTLFPSIVPDMISIGERTGSLSIMCRQISKMYEQELEDFIKHLSTSIEPVLMIAMGLIVGSVALSIILPIYEITNHLSK